MNHKSKDEEWRNELKTVLINGKEWKYTWDFFNVTIFEPYKKTGKKYRVSTIISPQTIKKFIIANIIKG